MSDTHSYIFLGCPPRIETSLGLEDAHKIIRQRGEDPDTYQGVPIGHHIQTVNGYRFIPNGQRSAFVFEKK